ncbi:MAG: FMN-binding protein [Actinobacteria bacterium]|jgi:electron transport complex protein RnfG|nr:MAG: FMN-binding protein [Actinomycetota bacterium]
MTKTVINLGLRLLIVCLVAATGLGFTYTLVEKRIAEQDSKRRAEAAELVLAPIGAQPQENPELTASLQGDFPDLIGVFEGVDGGGNARGYAFVLKSKGYNFITMAVGVDAAGQVTGIEVVTNEETPGLGAVAAENPGFLGQFNGKGPDALNLDEDIDGVTSATFTSRGITNGVNMALEIWRQLQENPEE